MELAGAQGGKGETGEDGTYCVTEAVAGGQKIICNGDSAGFLKDVSIEMDTSLAHLSVDGAKGDSGKKGENGLDGTYCLSESTEEGVSILCNGEVVGELTNGGAGENGNKGDDGVGVEVIKNEDGTYSNISGEDTLKIYGAICGTEPYDPTGSKFCSGVKLVDKCGGKGYVLGKEACCSDSVYTIATHFCATNNTVQKKCGTATFNPTTHLCDYRDNRLYTYKKIGTQTWMTENLKFYNTSTYPNLKSQSWCYNNTASECTSYGRLYSWSAAMNISSSYLTKTYDFSGQHRGICPEGWHVPRNTEWDALANYVDTNNGSEGVGTSLKQSSTWTSDKVKGTNRFGFNGIASGSYFPASTTFKYKGYVADFISATQASDASSRYILSLYSSSSEWPSYATTLHKSTAPKRQAYLLRCIHN